MKEKMIEARQQRSTVLAPSFRRSTKRELALERKELSMRFGNSLLLFALTAGLAVLAITGTKHEVETAEGNAVYEDVDAWFV